MSDMFVEAHPKARKEYYCDVCGHPIRKNEIQVYTCGGYGYLRTVKICRVCDNIIEDYWLASSEDMFTIDDLEMYLHHTFCQECAHESGCGLPVFDCPNIREAFGKEAEE